VQKKGSTAKARSNREKGDGLKRAAEGEKGGCASRKMLLSCRGKRWGDTRSDTMGGKSQKIRATDPKHAINFGGKGSKIFDGQRGENGFLRDNGTKREKLKS